MGIPNLLRLLRNITTRQPLSSYRGKRAGIDGYTWLHRSLYCIGDGILKSPIDISRCINFFTKKLQLLLKNDITPIFIFDGDKLPMKNNEEDKREIKRKEYLRESENLLKMNNIYGAIFKKIESFDVTPEFAYEFMKILNTYKIEYYVAPYEADAQLAYLSYINYVDFIITEDSDLLAYGCNCVLFKLGSLKNELPDVGEEILYENLKKSKEIRLKNFSKDKFLNFCILCGCDYLKIPGVGPKLSNEALNKFEDYNRFLGYIFTKNCTQGSITETIKRYEKSFLTFRYQVVYCPIEKKMKYFHNINEKSYPFLDKYKNDLSFLGNTEFKDINIDEYVKGKINPITKINIDEDNNTYFISKNPINCYSKNSEEICDNDDNDSYDYNYQGGNGQYLTQFNFFPKMGKYKPKKKNKNERPKNQFGIESFLGGNNKFKKIQKPIKKNIDNNKNQNNSINDENINNNEDDKSSDINDENSENSLNLNIFNKYIFNYKNSSNKRTSKDIDLIKDTKNIHSKNYTNSNLRLTKDELNSCYNPLTQYPKTKIKSSIGSKQKELYNKFNLKFQDDTEKKKKDINIDNIDLLDNYGFSETNYNSNKEIGSNTTLANNDLIKKNNLINLDKEKDKKDDKIDEDFIYIGDDDSNEEKVEKEEKEEKEEEKEENHDKVNFEGFNLDDYKNTVFTLDKF